MVRITVTDPRSVDDFTLIEAEPDQDQADIDDQLDLIEFLNEEDSEDDDATEVAGIVRTFSKASKRRLGRTIASLDWSVAILPGDRLALVTLTYPGEWRTACPTPDRAYRHFRALAKRFQTGDRP